MKKIKFFLLAGLIVTGGLLTACSDDEDQIDNPIVSDRDENFMIQASYGNWSEVSMGKLADSLSADAGVKMFGQHMQDDHSKAQDDLLDVANDWGVNLPDGPDSAHFKMRLNMQAMAPAMFDTAYIKGQIKDHEKTIALFEDAAANSNLQKLKDYANAHLPTIKMHKAMADTMAIRLMAR